MTGSRKHWVVIVVALAIAFCFLALALVSAFWQLVMPAAVPPRASAPGTHCFGILAQGGETALQQAAAADDVETIMKLIDKGVGASEEPHSAGIKQWHA